MEFENLLSMVNKLNKTKGEKCLVCHFPDKKSNLVKLRCSHYFHYNCILNEKKCPYCNKKISLKNIKIDTEYNILSKLETLNQEDKCQVILKTGKNKGIMCNRVNCRYHKNQSTKSTS